MDKLEVSIAKYRSELTSNFHRLRERRIWKSHVDGGMWFFEVTVDVVDDEHVKLNPHLHIILLCSKKFPVSKINRYLNSSTGESPREE